MKDDVQDERNKMLTRRVLRTILDEGEQKVPSTSASIMAAIRQEQRTRQEVSVEENNERREVVPITLLPQKYEIKTPRPRLVKRTLYGVLALAVVAVVIVASFGLFSALSVYRSASITSGAGSSSNAATTAKGYSPSVPVTTPTWSAVMISYRVNSTTVIANYDPLSEKYVVLAASLPVDTLVDGVSHDGHSVLYSVYDGLKTAYYVYPQATTDPIYTVLSKSSSAVWSTDDRYIFISTAKGIAQVDVQGHSTHLILPGLAETRLLNYRDDDEYLYFVKGYKGQAYAAEGTLNRVNVASGNVQQVTSCERGANFWLSPGGVTVYYTCPEQNGTQLYAVDSDGTNPHVFSTNIDNVIGYAVDGSPLSLVQTSGKYQVVQQDLNTGQETVVLADVAPGATTMMASDVAVAPGGQMLMAKGVYSGNGTATEEQIWYGDVVAGTSHELKFLQGVQIADVIGWDKLQVSDDMLTSTP